MVSTHNICFVEKQVKYQCFFVEKKVAKLELSCVLFSLVSFNNSHFLYQWLTLTLKVPFRLIADDIHF